MGLRVVTLVPDLRLLEGTVNLQEGVDAEEAEGGVSPSVRCLLTLAVLSGQVLQAGRSNWAEGPGPGRERRTGRRRRSLCWSRRWESGWWRRRSWGPLLSGLNPWMAAGECSWWLEGGHWGIPSGPGLPLTASAPLCPGPGHTFACPCVTTNRACVCGAAGRITHGACRAVTVCRKWQRGW